jgi:1-acyl-sn-glycerol-3-phosphate acyltransferase
MLWLYGSLAFWAIVFSPLLLVSHRATMWVVRGWARTVVWGARPIVGIRVEFRGLEHRPKGAAIIAGKHLSMIDTIAPFLVLDDACYVMKNELKYLPFLGWYAMRAKMVSVRREDGAKALKVMAKACAARLSEGRQIVIFPEGTRAEIDDPDPSYKPGVAALYRELNVPVALMATNSGKYWPAHGIDRKPGTIVFEFLPPLDAGLARPKMMAEMKTRLETASKRLIESD